jgi:hypothetical protein
MPILFLYKRYAALSAETILASELFCQKNYVCSSSYREPTKRFVESRGKMQNKPPYTSSHQHCTIAETQMELKEKLAGAHDAIE